LLLQAAVADTQNINETADSPARCKPLSPPVLQYIELFSGYTTISYSKILGTQLPPRQSSVLTDTLWPSSVTPHLPNLYLTTVQDHCFHMLQNIQLSLYYSVIYIYIYIYTHTHTHTHTHRQVHEVSRSLGYT
jgi:hypothetical protein